MKFTEEKLEKAFTELLVQEGFSHHLGITINEIKSIILQLKSLSSSDLNESNKTFLKILSDGFILKREDRNQKDI
jgi:type I restriction enzyme, R subunit